jgi:hypothetical protein
LFTFQHLKRFTPKAEIGKPISAAKNNKLFSAFRRLGEVFLRHRKKTSRCDPEK